MVNKEILQDKSMQKIFGHVEIQTIIKKIEGKPLKQTERNYLSRSIRPKLRAAALVTQENILSEINAKKKDSAIIEYNLAQYSYPLIILKKTRAKKLAIEELIIEILTNYPFARFIEAIPFLFLKNEIEQWKLLELAAKAGVKNKIPKSPLGGTEGERRKEEPCFPAHRCLCSYGAPGRTCTCEGHRPRDLQSRAFAAPPPTRKQVVSASMLGVHRPNFPEESLHIRNLGEIHPIRTNRRRSIS